MPLVATPARPAEAVEPLGETVAGTGDPMALRKVLRLLCAFSAYLILVEVLNDVFRWGGLVDCLLRFVPYCGFLVAVIFYGRRVAQPGKKTILLTLFLSCLFLALLMDVTKHLPVFDTVPLLGRASPVRKDVQSFVFVVAVACFFTGSYLTWAEIAGAKMRLQQEIEKLRRLEASLQESEEQLRQAQKMDAIGRLAGGIAHDFNTILMVIQGHCSFLRADKPGLDRRESVEQIQEAVARAANLTRQLLLFSRRQVMRRQPLDVNEVLNNLFKMLRRLLREDIALEFQGTAALPWIEGDPGMIEQVVMNLSVNARDAMPQGGRVTISTSLAQIDAARAGTHPEAYPGQFVCLAVSDTGCGMEEATRKRLFEPFFTTKPPGKGTGLGLATLYGIVKQHRGWTEVESTPGQGTTFRIYLPVALGAPRPPTAPAAENPARGGSETILLVEDEAPVRTMVDRFLQQKGYRVLVAANGPEAVELWATHRDQIDLLLADLVMPGGLNGQEVAERFRIDKPNLKVIIASGYLQDPTGPRLPAGPDITVLAKPFHLTELAATVRKCLEAS